MLILAFPLLIPLFFSGLVLVFRKFLRTRMPVINTVMSFIHFLCALGLLNLVWQKGTQVLELGGWPAPFGIVFVVDLFSASMVLITGLMGFAIAFYIWAEEKTEKVSAPVAYFVCFQTLIMGVCGSFLTGDLFNLYVWFEVMLMSSFVLIAFEGSKAQLEGAIKYTVLNLVASLFFLIAVGLIYGTLGTLNMAHLSQLVSERGSSTSVKAAFAFLLVAFGMKAGVFPLFFWLPASYHTPRVATSALLAGLLTKVGVYTLIRTSTLIFPQTLSFAQPLIIVIACLTMVTGVLGAAFHYDVRRILSFHIISQIGYMILGLGYWTQAAITASVFYILHHIIVKTNLFLIAGILERMKGTSELKRIGGLFKEAPGLAIFFLIPAMSLAGMPPLSGFFAKFSLIQAGFINSHFISVGIALLVGLLTLFSMIKIWLEAFWKPQPGSEKGHQSLVLQKTPWLMMVPVIGLATITLIIGLWPQTLFQVANRIAVEMLEPASYIQSVLKGRTL